MLPQKLYENIVIGNFLYALGFAIRSRLPSGSVPSVVNLLQQTPADTLLGDLLVEFPGAVRLIEFKTQDNRSDKEAKRHRALSAALQVKVELAAVSRRVHWFIESAPSDEPGRALSVRTAPYLDAYPPTMERGRLEPFIEALAADALKVRTIEDMKAEKEYLNWVRMTKGKGRIGTGGILLVAQANGAVRYMQLVDMLELEWAHQKVLVERVARLDRETAPRRERHAEQEHDLALPGPGREWERDF